MAKKIDYAALYSLRKDGRYETRLPGGKCVYDRDPYKLWLKVQAALNPQPPTFREIAEAWKETAWERITGGTKACYEAPYKRALERHGDAVASEVSSEEIYKVLLKMSAQGYSAKTIKMQRTVYKLIFQNAIISNEYSQMIQANPADSVPLPKGLKRPENRQAPDDEVIRAIHENAASSLAGLLAFLLICTGFRRGEALALTWADVNFDEATITCNKSLSLRNGRKVITAPKTEAGYRTVPLLPALAEVLKRPKGAKKTDPIFEAVNGGYLSEITYRRYWEEYCKEVLGQNLTAHVLRHGYATMLYEAGVDEYTAQSLLGHADITTTRAVYTHLRKEQKIKSIDKFNQHMQEVFEK